MFKTISKITILIVIAILATIIPVSATTAACTSAGDFSGICDVLTSLANGTLAVVEILFTGANASTIIEAAVILTIVGFILDLMRGKNSWVRNRFERV